MLVGYKLETKGMMPNMPGMPRMLARLTGGMQWPPLMGGLFGKVRIRMGDSRCRAFDEARNHGSASNANDNARDGDCCS
jgi:hypothetical protein